MRRRLLMTLLLPGLATLGLVVAGCSDSDDDEAEPTATSTEIADTHDDDEGADLTDAEVAESWTIEMQDFAFAPAVLEVEAGHVVEIAFSNTGAVTHDFTIEDADLDSMMMGAMEDVAGHSGDDHSAGFAMHVPLEVANGAMWRMRIHEPGEYVFYCTVPGHRQLGMEGTITVN